MDVAGRRKSILGESLLAVSMRGGRARRGGRLAKFDGRGLSGTGGPLAHAPVEHRDGVGVAAPLSKVTRREAVLSATRTRSEPREGREAWGGARRTAGS